MQNLIMAATAALWLAAPSIATAQDLRKLCNDRPGLGTPACTVDPGHVVVELGLGDWTRERDAGQTIDTLVLGDGLARVGLTDSLEGQIGWTSYGHVRTRDRTSGSIDRTSGVGDVSIALRQNLHNPDGSGFSLAVMPFATLPVGGSAIGDGDWGAGLIVPASFDLGAGLSLALTPELDAAVDEDGDGRHFAYGSVAGLGLDLTDSVSGTAEISLFRDEDPSGHASIALAGLSVAWQPSKALQLDVGTNIGLNANSPDEQIYFGVSRRF
ncbi:hypothetical protein BH10PSE12_BH10PSE12_09550 [soil metagenome]